MQNAAAARLRRPSLQIEWDFEDPFEPVPARRGLSAQLMESLTRHTRALLQPGL